jgi:hypothetical protein
MSKSTADDVTPPRHFAILFIIKHSVTDGDVVFKLDSQCWDVSQRFEARSVGAGDGQKTTQPRPFTLKRIPPLVTRVFHDGGQEFRRQGLQ